MARCPCYVAGVMLNRVSLAVLVVLFGCSKTPQDITEGEIPVDDEEEGLGDFSADRIATGLNNPVFLTAPTNDQRLFVVEKPGRIRIMLDDTLLDDSFLDITNIVNEQSGEQGLLGLAFHPDFETNRRFFVNYTAADPSGATVVAEYEADANNPNQSLLQEKRLLVIEQPFANHNGGMIDFGNDGYLYIGVGDGGSGGDPMGHGQNPQTLLGSILRIDVDQGPTYGIPADNPFASNTDGADEIWATGLRNPWRFSFGRSTGDLFIGDVGQNSFEEINLIESGMPGQNLGWALKEGRDCFRDDPCDEPSLLDPIFQYATGGRCSVIGGYTYDGDAIPSLEGLYMYADFCSDELFLLARDGNEFVANMEITDQINANENVRQISSFGEDADGELYILSLMGDVFKIVNSSL